MIHGLLGFHDQDQHFEPRGRGRGFHVDEQVEKSDSDLRIRRLPLPGRAFTAFHEQTDDEADEKAQTDDHDAAALERPEQDRELNLRHVLKSEQHEQCT